MEKNYKLLFSVLQELQKSGALQSLVLAGSWCQYFYKIYFHNSPDIPLLRTTDIDFLIPNPPAIIVETDVPQILSDLGFDIHFDYKTGLMKFAHPDLEIQFITPALGRGRQAPYAIKALHLNAEGLRYLTLLQNYSFTMAHQGISMQLPEPEAYVFQKLLASQERKDPAKREKDIYSALMIAQLCLHDAGRRGRLLSIFAGMPAAWRKKIAAVLRRHSPELFNFLSNDA